MDPLVVPPGLATALLAAGYRVGGPAGVGGGGPVWTATGPADGLQPPARVVVHALTVPPGPDRDGFAARLDALCAIDHPHLPRVVEVLEVAPEGLDRPAQWAVLVAEVPGATVGALLAARGRLSTAEVVTLTVPLAGALDALHRAGLVHGDVSPANVVVRPDGRPVLIDVLGSVTVPGGRRGGGTPGFTAPEVVAGAVRAPVGPPAGRPAGLDRDVVAAGAAQDRTGQPPAAAPAGVPTVLSAVLPAALPAGAPADVYALAAVGLAALDLGAMDGPLAAELTAACAADPILRPTAAELAVGCYRCAEPATIAMPDAGVLARTALAQLATQTRTVSARSGGRHRARGSRRPWRRGSGRRRRATLAAAVLTVLAAVLVAGFAGPVGGPWRFADGRGPAAVSASGAGAGSGAGAEGRVDSSRGGAVTDPDRPVAAAAELTVRRAEVLAAGDPARLTGVSRSGSAAHAADVALLERLAADGVRLEGLASVVERAVLQAPAPAAGTAPPEPELAAVAVAVTSRTTAHRRVGRDGVAEVPARAARTVVLEIAWTDDGWRVERVRDP